MRPLICRARARNPRIFTVHTTKSTRRQRGLHNSRCLVAPITTPVSSVLSLNSASLVTTSSSGDQEELPYENAAGGQKGEKDRNPSANLQTHNQKQLSRENAAGSLASRRPPEQQRQVYRGPFETNLFRNNQVNHAVPHFLLARTQSLLDTQIGSWAPHQWRKAVELLSALTTPTNNRKSTRQSSSPKATRRQKFQSFSVFHTLRGGGGSPGSCESVVLSFKLLERLLLEKRRSLVEESKKVANNNALMNTHLLNSVVRCWSYCWKALHEKTKPGTYKGDPEHAASLLLELTPETVLSRLDAYKARSSGLLAPNLGTYYTIMDAACASKTPVIAIKLLDRICGKVHLGTDFNQDVHDRFLDMCAKTGDAEQTEACLEHMYNEYVESDSAKISLRPTTAHFNKVLLAWSRVSAKEVDLKYAFERSQKILKKMQKLSGEGGALEGVSNPDFLSYSFVMKTISRWVESIKQQRVGAQLLDLSYLGDLAEDLITDMDEQTNQGIKRLRPNTISYITVLRIWEQLGNAERAEALLQRMYEDFTVNKNSMAEPNTSVFNIVMGALLTAQKIHYTTSTSITSSYGGGGKSKISEYAEKAEGILRRMQNHDESGELAHAAPNAASYHAVLNCWASSRAKGAGKRSLNILQEMQEASKKVDSNWVDGHTIGAILQAFAGSGDTENAERVAAEFHRKYFEEGDLAAKPTMRNLTILLNAHAKSSNKHKAPALAETILKEMHKLYDDGIIDEKPSVVSYTTVIECHAKSETVEGAQRAEALLLEMERRSRSGEERLRPTRVSYRNVIRAFASVGNVEKAEQILDRMFEDHNIRGITEAVPTTKIMNLVLFAIANSKSPESSKRAVALLKRMEQLSEAGKIEGKPDVVSYTLALKSFLNSKDPDAGKQAERFIDEMEEKVAQGDASVIPNTMTYGTAIQVYGRMGKPAEAEALLERMYQKYSEGNTAAQPNTRTFTSVLQAYARSEDGDSGNRAFSILQWMKDLHKSGVLDDVKPNAFTYSTVLSSISRSKRSDAPELALDLLEEMQEAFTDGDNDVRPNALTYNNVLQSIARSGDPMKAQEFISRMYHHHQSGLLSEKPNLFSWNLVIEAWARSSHPDAPLRASTVVERIRQLHECGDLTDPPDFATFKELLFCYKKSETHNTRKHILPIVDQMDKVAAAGDKRASMYDYFAVIRKLCETNDDELLARAEMMVDRMTDREGVQHFSRWNPGSVRASYAALISAWSRSRDHRAAEHVERLKRKRDALKLPRHH